MRLIWDITNNCNLNCLHCSNGDNLTTDYSKELTTLEVIKIINSFLEKEDVLIINVLGGEPFIRKDFLEIYRYCQKKHIRLNISTNGILLNQEKIKYIIKNTTTYTVFSFSLDGPTELSNSKIRGKDSFNKCVYNIKLFKKLLVESKVKDMIEIQISATINKYNYDILHKYIYLCNELNINYLSLTQLKKVGNILRNEDELIIKDSKYLLDKIIEFCKECNYKNNKLNLYIEYYPKILEKINNKYNLNIGLNSSYKCLILANTIYIDPYGNIEYCRTPQTKKYFKQKKIFPNKNLNLKNNEFNYQLFNKMKNDIKIKIDNNNKLFRKSSNCIYTKNCVTCIMHKEKNPCTFCENVEI